MVDDVMMVGGVISGLFSHIILQLTLDYSEAILLNEKTTNWVERETNQRKSAIATKVH